ncbi:MAG: glycosyltransferase [Paucibacter sp.]|nr:glycosyltransferase [Roseateles sp.]
MAKVSVLVKALNEERHIASCLESALRAVEGLDAEVILVDSLSTDRTVELARRYPVRIVQFQNEADRGCGAAVQLGYQVASGEYVYLLDGDMTLRPDFLAAALERLQADPGLAGVGGRLLDVNVRTELDRRRVLEAQALRTEVEVRTLGGGGLYRRSAIEQVGYLGHRWLVACEEAELGARLGAAGWRLLRLPLDAVEHDGHQENSRQTLTRLWRSGRARACGVFLRSALGQPWWRIVVRDQRSVLLAPGAFVASLVLVACAAYLGASVLGELVAATLPWLAWWAMAAIRKRSAGSAAWTVLSACLLSAGALGGFAASPRDPMLPIAARTLK